MRVSLKEFMKTEKFANLPTINGCHFGNKGCWTDVDPCLIIESSSSGKTIKAIELDYEVVKGSMGDGSAEYEFYLNLSDDGNFENKIGIKHTYTLCRGEHYKNNKVIYQQRSCKNYKLCVVSFPRKYYDPSF